MRFTLLPALLLGASFTLYGATGAAESSPGHHDVLARDSGNSTTEDAVDHTKRSEAGHLNWLYERMLPGIKAGSSSRTGRSSGSGERESRRGSRRPPQQRSRSRGRKTPPPRREYPDEKLERRARNPPAKDTRYPPLSKQGYKVNLDLEEFTDLDDISDKLTAMKLNPKGARTPKNSKRWRRGIVFDEEGNPAGEPVYDSYVDPEDGISITYDKDRARDKRKAAPLRAMPAEIEERAYKHAGRSRSNYRSHYEVDVRNPDTREIIEKGRKSDKSGRMIPFAPETDTFRDLARSDNGRSQIGVLSDNVNAYGRPKLSRVRTWDYEHDMPDLAYDFDHPYS